MEKEKSFWRIAVERGLIAGVVLLLISLIGMLEAFKGREIIGGLFTMSQVLIIGTFYLTGAATGKLVKDNPLQSALGSMLTGAVGGFLTGLLPILGNFVNLRYVLLNASPELYNILSFGTGPYLGLVVLTAIGAFSGLAGTLIDQIKGWPQRAISNSLVTIIMLGLLADLFRVTIEQWGSISILLSWMLAIKGLSYAGVAAIIVVVFALAYAKSRQKVKENSISIFQQKGPRKYVAMLAVGIGLLLVPPILGVYFSEVLDNVGIYILMGLGMNILLGYTGMFNLGFVAYYALGAYTVGVLTSPETAANPIPWIAAMPVALIVAIIAGVVLSIPVLRMRGDYLGIVTLGFGEIIRILAGSDLLKPWIGGANGITQIARPGLALWLTKVIPGFQIQQTVYYVILFFVVVGIFISIRLRDSRQGRAWMAIREDEDVAQAMGIDLVNVKLLAVVVSSALGGLAGALFAGRLSSTYPQSYTLMVSLNALCLIIVGGMGSIPGVVAGSLALVGLPDLLREFGEFRMLVYGALLVIMMLVKPEGLWPAEAAKREFYAEETPAAAD